jgi:hypothetical protein
MKKEGVVCMLQPTIVGPVVRRVVGESIGRIDVCQSKVGIVVHGREARIVLHGRVARISRSVHWILAWSGRVGRSLVGIVRLMFMNAT